MTYWPSLYVVASDTACRTDIESPRSKCAVGESISLTEGRRVDSRRMRQIRCQASRAYVVARTGEVRMEKGGHSHGPWRSAILAYVYNEDIATYIQVLEFRNCLCFCVLLFLYDDKYYHFKDDICGLLAKMIASRPDTGWLAVHPFTVRSVTVASNF